MNPSIQSLSKVNRPQLSGVLYRERLLRVLDEACGKPVCWIVGPGGSGKTTLAASYLEVRKGHYIWYQMDGGDADPATFFYYLGQAFSSAHPRSSFQLPLLTSEYLQDIGTFALRFFENLFSHFKASHTLVLDNYQDLPEGSVLHEILASAFASLPEHIRVVLLSRTEAPAAYSRLRANRRTGMIGWDQLRFTPEETREFADLEHSGRLSREQVDYLHSITEGWAAGLILMLEHFRTRNFAPGCVDGITPDGVFDYFAGEVFDKIPEGDRSFLLKTALLPKMSARIAESLSGDPRAGRTLKNLSRSNFFTYWHSGSEPVYSYHPLFRRFLLARGEELFSAAELRDLRLRASGLLESAGWIDDAVELCVANGDQECLAGLITGNAAALVTQGRCRTVEGWMGHLQPDLIARDPWLLYWQGCCRMDGSLTAARASYEAALTLFDGQRDAGGAYLAWSGVVDTFFYEMRDFSPLDHWLARFDSLEERYPGFPNRTIEIRVASSIFTALVLRQSDHDSIVRRGERLAALIDSSVDPHIRLHVGLMRSLHYIWTGDYRRNGLLLESLRAESMLQHNALPFMKITLHALEAMHFWQNVRVEECLKAVELGRQLGHESGVHVWDNFFISCIAQAAILMDDRPMLQSALSEMGRGLEGATTLEHFTYHILSAWSAWLEGHLSAALGHMERGHSSALTIGSKTHEAIWSLGMGQLLADQGSYAAALESLETCFDICRINRGRNIEFMALLVRANIRFATGDDERGIADLRRGLAVGCDEDYGHFIWWRSPDVAELCIRALEAGIETEYVRRLIKRRDLVPSRQPLTVEKWPWQIRIFSLGRFEVELCGEPLIFSGKAQKKPLELLKVLISLGGSYVPQNKLTEALWPDQDEDIAMKSLKATIYRLRQLMGNEGVVRIQEGLVYLERRHVWVDIWAFEELLDAARQKWSLGEWGEAQKLTEKGIALYKGQFLVHEGDKPWAFRTRERLRARFLSKVGQVCSYWHDQGEARKAIDCYQQVLAVDDQAEEFYRHLMQCYMEIGNRAEAIKVYERCRFILAHEMGITPSPQTEALYREVRGE